jgi:DNA repair exonuclease SbcCD ATPase subunit
VENVYSLLTFRDNTKSLMNINTEKIEVFSKSVRNQIENMESGIKVYARSLIEMERNHSKSEIENLESKISNIKLDNHKFAVEFKNAANELIREKEELLVLKSNFQEKIIELNRNYENANQLNFEKVELLSAEFDIMNKRFSELSETIKVLSSNS